MFNAVMSQLPTAKIKREVAKEFDDMVRSGSFVQKVEDRPRVAEIMASKWPGLSKLKDQKTVLKLANELSGVQRGDLIKAMEKAKWRNQGFPEIGVTRVAVTDPALLSAPTNTIGHRIVRFDTENAVSPTRRFEHQTYPTESLGRYVADVPLVQTQYGMPSAIDRLLSKPTKSGEIMHPYSIDPLGRSSARKMFTEQKQVQPIDDRTIENIMLGLERQSKYGLKRGGKIDRAMRVARKAGGKVLKHDLAEGLTINVETPRGHKRDHHGANPLPVDYGYFPKTKGADGMAVDAFVGPDKSSDTAYIINQYHPVTKKFDEHKVMIGFKSRKSAEKAYKNSYPAGLADKMERSIVEMSKQELKDWLKKPSHKTPVS
jgi:hypothetical protein